MLTSAGCSPALVGVVPADGGSTFGATPGEIGEVGATLPADSGGTCNVIGEPRTVDHQALLDAVNLYRQENGLEPLLYSKTLEQAADAMASDIVARNFFAHVDPDGNSPVERALAAGFCHEYVGENLATGYRDVASVMEGWKASEGHNANLLHSEYVFVGIGVVRTAQGGAVWVQDFAFDPDIVAVHKTAVLAR